jgi:hypothetical protein
MLARVSDRPAKAPDVEVNVVADGYVVYHAARDRVHYLNHTAAVVLELCDGDRDRAAIARLVQRAYDLPEPPEREVTECLGQLGEEGLIA